MSQPVEGEKMKWVCVYGFHNWSKWSAIKTYDQPDNTDYQDRECLSCGVVQRRDV